MSLFFFLSYLAVALVRPTELFGLEFGPIRPIFILWVLAFLSSVGAALARREFAARPAQLGLLGALMLAIALSHLKTGWVGGAQASLAHFSTSAGLFILVCLNATSLRRLLATIGVAQVSIGIVAVLSVLSFHTGWKVESFVLGQWNGMSTPSFETFESGDRGLEPARVVPGSDQSGQFLWRIRGLGFLNDPNDFAQTLVLALPLLWIWFRSGRHLRNALLVWLPALAILYVIYLTHSRGAILGAASLLFFGLQRRLGTLRLSVLLGTMGAVATVTGFGGGREFSANEESAGSRIEAWYAGIQMLKANPLLGVGYGGFPYEHHLTAHNSFVLCFAEIGLIGYFFWMGLIVVTYLGLRQVLQTQTPGSEIYRVTELLRSALIGFLTCAFFLSRAFEPMLFLVLGLCAAAWYCAMRGPTPRVAPLPAGPRGAAKSTAPAPPAWAATTATTCVVMIVVIYLFVLLGG